MTSALETNPFPNLPGLDQERAAYLARHTSTEAAAKTIQSVLAIGAVLNQKWLRPHDEFFIQQALLCSRQVGLGHDTAPQIRIANLIDGHNYLTAPKIAADLVILSYIPKEGAALSDQNQDRWISPQGHAPELWRDRIAENSPLMVVSIENGVEKGEITAWDICPAGYRQGPAFDASLHFLDYGSLWPFKAHTILREDVARALPRPPHDAAQSYTPPRYTL